MKVIDDDVFLHLNIVDGDDNEGYITIEDVILALKIIKKTHRKQKLYISICGTPEIMTEGFDSE